MDNDTPNDTRSVADAGDRAVDAIAGIGPKRRRWLASVMGVRTTAELASVDALALARQLAEAGDLVGAHRSHEWIAEARRELAVASSERDGDEEWTEFEPTGARSPVAAFVVEVEQRADVLVTAVHHMERDQTRYWRGLMPPAACAWIASQTRSALAEPDE